MQFFQLVVGGNEDAWHLRIEDNFPDGTPVDIWAYRGFRRLERPEPVPFAISVEGRRIDHYRDAFGNTIVSQRLADLWESWVSNDIQRIPAVIEGEAACWEVINITRIIGCIDYEQSIATHYPGLNRKNAGKLSGITRLIIDPERVGDHHIFHPKDWEIVTIVSDAVMKAMAAIDITGVDYLRVS